MFGRHKELIKMKLVSIIIPVINEEVSLRSFLPSLQNLREDGCEIILVDGGSSDGSCEVAKPLVDKLLVTNRGRASQMNFGAKSSNGEILIFLHADTQLNAQAITFARDVADRFESFWGWYSLRFQNSSYLLSFVSCCMRVRSSITKICTGDQTLFISSTLFSDIGGFPDIPIMEDIAICKLLRTRVAPIQLKSRVLSSPRRWQRDGLLKTVFFMWYLRFLYWLGFSPVKLSDKYYPEYR